MPSVRDMANMTLNPSTVQKAYQRLEGKVVVTVRGRGTFISRSISRKDKGKMNEVKEIFKRDYWAFYMGFDKQKYSISLKICEMEG